MDYSVFIKSIESQDKRNVINRVQRQVCNIPNQLKEFLNQYDPVDMEVVLNDLSAVRFYSYNYIHQLQIEYNLGEKYFVFATKNSDPIALLDQRVVTIVHGSKSSEIEEIAESFEQYIARLLENIRC